MKTLEQQKKYLILSLFKKTFPNEMNEIGIEKTYKTSFFS